MGLYSLQDYSGGGSLTGGDLSDPTGLRWSWDSPNPPVNMFEPMPGFNALHLAKLGWFPNPAQNIVQIGDIAATSKLKMTSVASAVSGTSSPAAVKFGNYWVSLRTKSGMDSALQDTWSNRLYIHKYDSTNALTSHLVTAPLNVGDSYVDANNNAISFDSLDGETASVQFKKCVQAPPTLSLQSSSKGTLKVLIKNNDKNCPAPRYRLAAEYNGIACAFDPQSAMAPVNVWVHLVLDINYLEDSFILQFDDKVALEGTGADFGGPEYLGHYTVNPQDIGRQLTFTIKDMYGDGICCQYGGGSYYEVGIGNAVMRHGGEFACQEVTQFLALPTTMLTVPSSTSSSTVLSYDQNASSVKVVMNLVQLGADGQSNGRPPVIATYKYPSP